MSGIASDPETVAMKAAMEAYYGTELVYSPLSVKAVDAFMEMENAKFRWRVHAMRLMDDAKYREMILKRREGAST